MLIALGTSDGFDLSGLAIVGLAGACVNGSGIAAAQGTGFFFSGDAGWDWVALVTGLVAVVTGQTVLSGTETIGLSVTVLIRER